METTPILVRDLRPGMVLMCQTRNGTEHPCAIVRVDNCRAVAPGDPTGKRTDGSRVMLECGDSWAIPNYYTEPVASIGAL